MKEIIHMIVKSIVDHPEDIQINCMEGEKTLIFELKLHADDVGKVIGKRGRTVNALRTLLKAIATKGNQKVMLEILQ